MNNLEYWIEPQHLIIDAIQNYAARFAGDPHLTIWLDDFLLPMRLAGLQRMFATEGEFKEIRNLFDADSKDGSRDVTSIDWHSANTEEQFRYELQFTAPRTEYALGVGIVTYLRFQSFVRSPPFLTFLDRITGVTPAGVEGLLPRITRYGHRLTSHSDVAPTRCLCGILYLSENWIPEFGGRFRQYRRNQPTRALNPVANRLTLFRPISEVRHDVEPLSEQAMNWERWAITIWYSPANR